MTDASDNSDGHNYRAQEHVPESEPVASRQGTERPRRKSTGPRTSQGKQRSKLNALKHGLFSKSVLLDDESRTEYEALWDGLKQDFQPHGMAESVLVEHLSVVLWRKRRFLEVERAEISKRDFLMGDFSVTEEAQKLDYVLLPTNLDSQGLVF